MNTPSPLLRRVSPPTGPDVSSAVKSRLGRVGLPLWKGVRLALLLASAGPAARAQFLVLPGVGEQGSNTNTPVQVGERSIQFVYDAAQLAGLPLGARLTGMAYRLNTAQPTGPATDRTFASYDVQLATSSRVRPGLLSPAYASNMGADLATVRSGPLTIAANSFPGGTGPNAFGPEIPFSTPFSYAGGHLVVLVRHTGNGVDAPILDAASDLPGSVQARIATAAGAYTATTSTGGGVTPVVRWTWQPPSGPQEIAIFNGPTATHPQLADLQTTAITFGTVPGGTTGQPRTFTVGNLGGSLLAGLSVFVDGPDAGDFTVQQPAADSVLSGGAVTFKVTFHPSGIATRAATLHVLSNDVDEASFDVPLRGTGSFALQASFREANVVVGQANFLDVTGVPGAARLAGPTAIALSVDGKLAVTEQHARRTLLWNQIPTSSGQPADVVVGKANFSETAAGTTQSLTSDSNGVAFSPDGSKLIVCDSSNNRVLIWNTVPTTNGAPASVVIGQTDFVTATSGVSATKLLRPVAALAAPDGRLIIDDQNNHRLLVYNSIPTANGAAADLVIGQPDMESNTLGTTADRLNFPWALALSSDGRLIVADQSNQRVLIFNSIPTSNGVAADVVIGQTNFTSNSSGTSVSKFSAPLGLALSPSGKLAVTDANNDRVLIFNAIPTANGAAADLVLGQPNFTTNSRFTGGMSASSMSSPYAAAFTEDGRILVAGRPMCRLMIFHPAVAALTAPATGSLTRSPVQVSFALQESVQPGLTQLIFDEGVGPVALSLANTQESAGPHSFTFDPAQPTASPAIAAGPAIPDGLYAITLSYVDFASEAVSSPVATNVRIDTTAPTFALPAAITVQAASPSGAVVSYAASVSDGGSGVATGNFVPASGSLFPLGTTTVQATATDFAGNAATGSFTVRVLAALEFWKFTQLGDANAPDLGDPDADGLQTLAEYALVLPPAVPSSGSMVTRATYAEGERLRMTLTRDPARSDVTVEVQAAASLAGPWTSVATSTLGAPFTGPGYVSGDAATAGVKTVEVRDTVNIPAATPRFMRVKVTH